MKKLIYYYKKIVYYYVLPNNFNYNILYLGDTNGKQTYI